MQSENDKVARVEAGRIVKLEYELTKKNGELIESSNVKGPLEFVVGKGQFLPGLEQRLIGLEPGKWETFTLPPEEAFGAKDSGQVLELAKTVFPQGTEFKVGARFSAKVAGPGMDVQFEVVENKIDTVVVRVHHPLEGEAVTARVRVLEIQESN